MIRKIVPTNDKMLRKKSKRILKIDKKVKALIKDLKDTLVSQTDPEGIGLAAIQIGVPKGVFIMRPHPELPIKTIINPEVVWVSKEKQGGKGKKSIMEGCLSLPNFYGPLKRAKEIKIKYLDEKSNKKTQLFSGLEAQIIQHEMDHLKGTIFVDRLLKQKTPLYEYIEGEWEEVDLIM